MYMKNKTYLEDLEELVGQVNQCLLKTQDSLLSNNGVTDANIDYIGSIWDELGQLQNQIQYKTDNLPQSELMNINVSWVDGRYFPLAFWMNYYNIAVARIQKAINDYAERI